MITCSFQSLIDQYKIIFFDGYGVIKNYAGLVPGIHKTFEYLEETNKDFYIVTNDASRSPQQLAASYNKLGLTSVMPDHLVSSGMLAKEYIDLKVNGGIVAFLGTEDSAHYIESESVHPLPLDSITDSNIDEVNALVFLDDEGFDWTSNLNKAINLLRKRNIPVIVANTDYAYPVHSNEVAIAVGALSHMIENISGKEFIRFGKPDSQMFMFAYDMIREKKPVSKKDILMVGDTLETDILGGNKFGLDTVLVLTGNTLEKDAQTHILSTGILPTHICRTAAIG